MSQVIGHSDDEIVNMANLLPDDNVVMDYHPYNSFVPIYSTLSVEQNIAIVYNQRRDLIRRLNESNAYAFVGKLFQKPHSLQLVASLNPTPFASIC